MKELLQKISKVIDETFAGNHVFSDEELTQIYTFTGNLLRNYECDGYNRISQEYDQLVFVAMVNATKTWNCDEDTFWESIYKKLIGKTGSQKIYAYLTSVVSRLGTQGKIMYLSGCTKRYYATILAHAFAPLNSIESFLDLCWDLYSEDMNFTYTQNDDIFALVVEELKKVFSNEKSLDDDLKLGSSVYSLRAGIKRMAIDAPQIMTNYIENTISLLERVFSGEILSKDQYYNIIIRDWWAKKEKTFGVVKPKKESHGRAITDYSTIRPKYVFKDNHVFLMIPSVRLKSDFYKTPYLNVYRNGILANRLEMYTYGSGITMAIKEMYLDVDNLLLDGGAIDFTLEIEHDGKIIYNSKTSLIREYILFKDYREILQDECLFGNYVLYAPRFCELSSYPRSIRKVPNELYLYIFQSQENEILQNPKRTVFFVAEKQNRSIRFIANRKSDTKFIHNGEEFIVIDGELEVVVSDDIDISKYGVRYESADFRLSAFSHRKSDGCIVYSITELLNVCEPQKIVIFSYVDNKIEDIFNVVKFNNISITYDKKLYFDKNNCGTVHFQTEKYDKIVSFDINQGDIIIPFDDGDIVLSPPVLKWKIDDGEFSIRYEEDLWYQNFSNSAELVIELPTMMSYQVILNNRTIVAEAKSLNSFKLGETIYSMISGDINEIVVLVKVEDIGIVSILTICLKEKFKSPPFIISGTEMLWNSSKAFIGNSKAIFRISFFEKNVLKNHIDISETLDEKYESRRFSLSSIEIGVYNVTVDLIQRSGFFEKAIRLFEEQVVIGDINKIRFKRKYLIVDKVMLTGKASDQLIKPFYVDNISYIGYIDNCLYYIGKIYIMTRDGKKVYLDTMKNSEGTYDDVNPIRIELRSDNSCFIVFGVNPDNMEDFISEFTLDRYNKICNLDDNTRGIDYFLFSTWEERKNV